MPGQRAPDEPPATRELRTPTGRLAPRARHQLALVSNSRGWEAPILSTLPQVSRVCALYVQSYVIRTPFLWAQMSTRHVDPSVRGRRSGPGGRGRRAGAVIIGCCSDPAFKDARRASVLPVVGVPQAGASVAGSRGRTHESSRRACIASHREPGSAQLGGLRTFLLGKLQADPFPCKVQGEESAIGDVTSTVEIVDRRFFRRFGGPGVEAAHDVLRHEPIDGILSGAPSGEQSLPPSRTVPMPSARTQPSYHCTLRSCRSS